VRQVQNTTPYVAPLTPPPVAPAPTPLNGNPSFNTQPQFNPAPSDPLRPSSVLQERKRFELLPNSLLWAPPLAQPIAPRIAYHASGFVNELTRQTTDVTIGQTIGIGRFQPQGWPNLTIQVDGYAAVAARFSEFDTLIAEDYYAGVPITFRRGNWHGKIGYEHISTHLGDEIAELRNLRRTEFQKDEVAVGLGYLFQDRLRIYGQAGYAFSMVVQDPDASRWRFDVGGEWFDHQCFHRWGQPFAAANVNFDGAKANFAPTVNAQVGWMFRRADRRMGQFRFYGFYANGRSQYGQLNNFREEFGGFGVSLDY
jgi:hypothetical protein